MTEPFVKFDYENYKPRPKSAHQIQVDKDIEEYNKKSTLVKAIDYIAECFSMQKTPERIFNERKHSIEWKASGVKSWRELFNLD
jgi:hypothetical protein